MAGNHEASPVAVRLAVACMRCTLAGVLALLGCLPAHAGSNTFVTGTWVELDKDGQQFTGSFSCTGFPTCTGLAHYNTRVAACSNWYSTSDAIVIYGLNIGAPGTFTMTIKSEHDAGATKNPDGTCTYAMIPPQPDSGASIVVKWNGSNGTLQILNVVYGMGTISANVGVPPVFPMTVMSTVTPTTSTATAQIQPRPQDAGTSENVFVFAQVPASLLGKAVPKRVGGDPPLAAATRTGEMCILAQLNANGQLVPVSASTMVPYFTGVLSQQGQLVTILNNVQTPGIAGATFFVGYGTNANAMLVTGVYQTALVIPGATQCQSSLANAPAPATPGALTGLWWNADESGWGVHFTQRRNVVFAAWYTYDGSGNAKWYVAPNCAMPSGTTGTTGTCSGDLYEVHAGAFFGAAFDPSKVNGQAVGTLQVSFTDANSATMTYTVNGQGRTLAITREVFQTGTTTPAVDYTDIWWNPSESGWGMAIAHQYGVAFLAWYVYDANGKPVWYVVPNCAMQGSSCSGTVYGTTGPAFGPTFDSSKVHAFSVGSASVIFTDANHGLLIYNGDGVNGVKPITRQQF